MIFKHSVYMCKRDAAENNYPNTWQFPNGDLIDANENPIDACARLVEENTGLEIDTKRFQYMGPIMTDPTSEIRYVYYVELFQGEYPRHRHPLMAGPWYLFRLDLAQKFNLMEGLYRVFDILRVLFE